MIKTYINVTLVSIFENIYAISPVHMSENIIRLVVSKSKAAMSLYYFMIQVSNLICLAYHRTVPRHPRFPSLSPLCHSTHAGLLCCCGSIGRHRRRARVVMFTTVYDRGLDQREEETTSPRRYSRRHSNAARLTLPLPSPRPQASSAPPPPALPLWK